MVRRIKAVIARWRARREYKRRLESLVPKTPTSWDDVIDRLPVIEI